MKSCDGMADRGRRFFLTRGAFVAAAGAAAAAVPTGPAEAAVGAALVNYPSRRLANVNDLKVDKPVIVAYPDKDSPGVLIKLGRPVPGGAGPTATSSPSPPCARTRDSPWPTTPRTAR